MWIIMTWWIYPVGLALGIGPVIAFVFALDWFIRWRERRRKWDNPVYESKKK